MRDLADSYGIKLICAGAESPWSNSIYERLNGVLVISVQKIQHDTNCNLKIALVWGVSARNSLQNCYRYSPNQLVFSSNLSFPNFYNGNPTVLEERTASEIVADNLKAMHSVSVEFLKNESNEKLRKALLHQVRSSDVDNLNNGDSVFSKRNDSDKLYGPGVVIGKDGKQVLARHGGTYVRVHICRLQHAPHNNTEKLFVKDKTNNVRKSQSCDSSQNIQSESEDDVAGPSPTATDGRVSEFVTPRKSGSSKPVIRQRIECWPKHDGNMFSVKVISPGR
jgi:hypothetical protein